MKAPELSTMPTCNHECRCGNYKFTSKIKKLNDFGSPSMGNTIQVNTAAFIMAFGCGNCGRYTSFLSHRQAIEAWNRGDYR